MPQKSTFRSPPAEPGGGYQFKLYHLEIVLQNTLETFVNEDAWEMFYSELSKIAQQ